MNLKLQDLIEVRSMTYMVHCGDSEANRITVLKHFSKLTGSTSTGISF